MVEVNFNVITKFKARTRMKIKLKKTGRGQCHNLGMVKLQVLEIVKVADTPEPPAQPLGIVEGLCTCLVDLRGFCSQMRGIARPDGITPSIQYTSKKANQDVQLQDLKWEIRKVGVIGEVIPELVPKLVLQQVPQMPKAMATYSDGAVISTPIPATQSEGPLLMETNSIWNGHSYGIDNVEITCKRKRSN